LYLTTGYSWEAVEVNQAILRPVGKPEFTSDSTALGAGGVQILRFEAASPGRTALRLAYHRPWEKDVAPLKVFSVQVAVR